MSKELPYFRFTPQEWQNGDISLESYHLQGLFVNIMAYYWVKDCSITQAMLKKRFNNAQADIETLVELGIIKVDKKDYIHIDFLNEQFDMLSQKRKNRQLAGSKGGKQSSSKAQAKSKQSSSYKDKDKDKDKDKEYYLFAKQLSEIIQKSKNIKHTEKQIKSWSNEIRKLSEMNGVNKERIQKALDWYSQNIGGQYIPVIESGSAFRDKFMKLENAMKRPQKKEYNPQTDIPS